jgi:hypothetical protein
MPVASGSGVAIGVGAGPCGTFGVVCATSDERPQLVVTSTAPANVLLRNVRLSTLHRNKRSRLQSGDAF